jgi:molybdate-binding protein
VIYRVVEETGELLLHGVAVKPGKPMLVGRLAGSAYVGLPGYPVSALTIFRAFVAPAIRRAAGRPEPETATVEGRMAHRERYSEGRLRYMPAGLVTDGDGDTLVYPVDKGSGATTSLVEADGIVAVPPDVEYLDEGEHVEVQLFSPDVRPPTLLGAGEDDPALSRLLDRVDRPRYLAVGSRQGRRRLRDGVTDVAVVTGEEVPDGRTIGAWNREWGLVVPEGNPEDVEGLADLLGGELRFVNRTADSGLRATFEGALDEVAADRGIEHPGEAIDGFGIALRGHEAPPRSVLDGDADAGLGLRATAGALGLGFVPCGTERVSVVAAADRAEKPGVEALSAAIEEGSGFGSLPGYGVE